jgi:hypothetical protein
MMARRSTFGSLGSVANIQLNVVLPAATASSKTVNIATMEMTRTLMRVLPRAVIIAAAMVSYEKTLSLVMHLAKTAMTEMATRMMVAEETVIVAVME